MKYRIDKDNGYTPRCLQLFPEESDIPQLGTDDLENIGGHLPFIQRELSTICNMFELQENVFEPLDNITDAQIRQKCTELGWEEDSTIGLEDK